MNVVFDHTLESIESYSSAHWLQFFMSALDLKTEFETFTTTLQPNRDFVSNFRVTKSLFLRLLTINPK